MLDQQYSNTEFISYCKDRIHKPGSFLRIHSGCGFIKQKELVPDDLFNPERLKHILIDFDPQSMDSSNYYQAILQNLFFATLNRPIKTVTYDKDGNEHVERRCFATNKDKPDVKSKYRYQELFKISEDKILSLFEFIPFMNAWTKTKQVMV